MSKKKVFLNVSDLASYIGQNIYDYVTPFERVWKKVDELDFHKAIEHYQGTQMRNQVELKKMEFTRATLDSELQDQIITRRQHTIRTRKLENEIKDMKVKIEDCQDKINDISLTDRERLEQVVDTKIMDLIKDQNTETDIKRQVISNQLEDQRDKVTEREYKKLNKIADSYINKTHGTLKEDSAIQIYETRYSVTLDTSQSYHKKFLYETENRYWYLGGRVDGLTDEYVIEVKNRVKGFFSRLRPYEKTQIQIYMHILGMDQARLVEKLGNDIKVTQIYRDQEYIDWILKALKVFIDRFEDQFMKNNYERIRYVNKTDDEKRLYLNELYLDEIQRIDAESLDSVECVLEDL